MGFEYQMLKSQATIGAVPEAEGAVGAAVIAEPAKWTPTIDENNLELMTIGTLTTEDEVKQTVGQMAEVGARVATATLDHPIDVGRKRIKVTKPDDSAQPQVNFDLPLRAMGKASFGATLDELRTGPGKMFGAEHRIFGWSAESSEEQMEFLAAWTRDPKPGPAQIRSALYGKPEPKDPDPLADLYEDIRGYVLLELSQFLQSAQKRGGGKTKDVPLLVKTSATVVRDDLASRIAAKDSSIAEPAAKLTALSTRYVDLALSDYSQKSQPPTRAKLESGFEGGSLYDWPRKPTTSQAEGEQGQPGLLLELRRAPVIPVNQWVGFATYAFHEVGELFHPTKPASQVGDE